MPLLNEKSIVFKLWMSFENVKISKFYNQLLLNTRLQPKFKHLKFKI